LPRWRWCHSPRIDTIGRRTAMQQPPSDTTLPKARSIGHGTHRLSSPGLQRYCAAVFAVHGR